MRLTSLIPRPLDPATDADGVAVLGALLTAAHLDRRLARELGWRGVRPSATDSPAWTCRIAGSPHVFGLVALGGATENASLHSNIALCVFPHPEDPALETFPLSALREALNPGYSERVRGLSEHAEHLTAFQLGLLRLSVRLDGSGLSLTVSAPARHRTVALDGVGSPGDWVIPPGGLECDVPAFRLLLRFTATLTASAETLFDEKARLSLGVSERPGMGFDAGGTLHERPAPDPVLQFMATLGNEAAHNTLPAKTLSALPARHRPSAADTRLPVLHLLTGFLGSGKTTFLRNWLDFLHNRERYTGVIQNEFGAVGLDAALMQGDTRVEALDEGCVCCSLADSLRPGLLRLMDAMPAEQFILETTGLANPANVLAALAELGDLVTPGLVVTVVDILDLCRNRPDLDTEGIRLTQLENADVLICNKADAVTADELHKVAARLRVLNPRAVIFPARHGSMAFAELDALYMARLDADAPPDSPRPALARFVGTHAAEGYTSRVLALPNPVSEAEIRALLQTAGPGLCRAKGIVELRGEGPRVAQYAAGELTFHPAPENAPDRCLVLIGTGLQGDDRGSD